MAENKMEALAKLFGLELEEEFEVERAGVATGCRYKFTESGLQYFDTQDATWGCDDTTLLELFINTNLHTIKKLPYKPKDGEQYWTVYRDGDNEPKAGFRFWCDCVIDKMFYKNGCVYRTQEECERHLKSDYEKLTGETWQW